MAVQFVSLMLAQRAIDGKGRYTERTGRFGLPTRIGQHRAD
jgi:hypothetical protein